MVREALWERFLETLGQLGGSQPKPVTSNRLIGRNWPILSN
jgi:hypothetical protein